MITEKQFKISEMTKVIGVEAHVLRYWEDELQLPIKRNELGHRYYTQDDVERFCQIKLLKEKGIQLKGIRAMLDLPQDTTSTNLATNYSESRVVAAEYALTDVTTGNFPSAQKQGEKAYRLQLLLKELVKEAVQESNEVLVMDMKESIIKELDYQFRVAAEEQELQNREYRKQQEEYFDKLDHMIQDSRVSRKKRTMGLFKFTSKAKSES